MIEPKEKRCKGNGKTKGWGCGKLTLYRHYNLCNVCYPEWLLNSDEGAKKLKKSIILGKKKSDGEIKKENKKQKIENKSIASLIQEARTPFQKLIRIRDHGQNCICCDRPLPFNIGDYDGGHFFKAQLYTGLIFHPDNVHGQLKYCNKYEHGNETGYSDGLKRRIGIERYNTLESIKNSLKTYKWDRYKLIELKDHYTKELRLVEKGLKNINDVDLTVGII